MKESFVSFLVVLPVLVILLGSTVFKKRNSAGQTRIKTYRKNHNSKQKWVLTHDSEIGKVVAILMFWKQSWILFLDHNQLLVSWPLWPHEGLEFNEVWNIWRR